MMCMHVVRECMRVCVSMCELNVCHIQECSVLSVYVCVCVCVCVCVHMYVHVCVCVCVSVRACVCIHCIVKVVSLDQGLS